MDLYDNSPEDGRVVCVDEFGPLNPKPSKDKLLAHTANARRISATTV
ncbi:hypothetical protein [Rhodococcus sp. T7]|nr:hypothetical protein [Rhodococcus sp. T7]